MTHTFSLVESAKLALQCLDLTSLNDNDTPADIEKLCSRAKTAFGNVAAVCVWPRFVAQARSLLPADIQVAAVVNFPHGGLDVAASLAEVQMIVESGGNEVDVVLPYQAFMSGQTQACTDFLAAIRQACGQLTLKVIIESGVLADVPLIARATRLAVASGADFVKTSTGKTPISATPDAATAILLEISACGSSSVGFKASGGIRSVPDAKAYLELVANRWGAEALNAKRFRFGASGLLNDIEAVLKGQQSTASTSAY
jgi:deoxyribose-phosphate aldolase